MNINETKVFEHIPVIYGIQCRITKKWYIGSCLDFKKRMERHRWYLRHNRHHSPKLQRAYNKYGAVNFDVSILEYLVDVSKRFTLEEQFIKHYDSKRYGYNILDNCLEVKEFSLSSEARKNFLNHVKTLERSVMAFDRFTGAHIGTFESVSAAARHFHTCSSNISSVCNNKLNYIKDAVFVYTEDYDSSKDYRRQHHNKGASFTKEHKRNMAMHNSKARTIYKYDLNHNLVATYYARLEAERQNGMKKEYLRYRLDTVLNGFIYSEKKLSKDIV